MDVLTKEHDSAEAREFILVSDRLRAWYCLYIEDNAEVLDSITDTYWLTTYFVSKLKYADEALWTKLCMKVWGRPRPDIMGKGRMWLIAGATGVEVEYS